MLVCSVTYSLFHKPMEVLQQQAQRVDAIQPDLGIAGLVQALTELQNELGDEPLELAATN
jgi:hypothetical protein